jgi:hypothetical protein
MAGDQQSADRMRLTQRWTCICRIVLLMHSGNEFSLIFDGIERESTLSWFRGLHVHGPRIDPTCAYNRHERMKDGEMDQDAEAAGELLFPRGR